MDVEGKKQKTLSRSQKTGKDQGKYSNFPYLRQLNNDGGNIADTFTRHEKFPKHLTSVIIMIGTVLSRTNRETHRVGVARVRKGKKKVDTKARQR